MSTRSGITIGMTAGGVLGGTISVFLASPITVGTGIVLGVLIGGAAGWFISVQLKQSGTTLTTPADHTNQIKEARIMLREEELDILKFW